MNPRRHIALMAVGFLIVTLIGCCSIKSQAAPATPVINTFSCYSSGISLKQCASTSHDLLNLSNVVWTSGAQTLTNKTLTAPVLTSPTADQLTVPLIYGSSSPSGTLTLASTSDATKGKIYFGVAQGSTFDSAKNRWGIGTTTPGTQIEIVGTSTATAQERIRVSQNSASGGGGIVLTHSRAGDTAPLAGDRLGYLLFGSWDGSALWPSASISAYAEANWNFSNLYQTYLAFTTTGATGYRTERLRITGTGGVNIGTYTTDPGANNLNVGGNVTAANLIGNIDGGTW